MGLKEGEHSKDSQDIEVIGSFTSIPSFIQSLLELNPRVLRSATVKPSAETKVEKHKWKRNSDKSCNVNSL